jgi:hypothetical protein
MKPGQQCTRFADHKMPHEHDARGERMWNDGWRSITGRIETRCSFVEPAAPEAAKQWLDPGLNWADRARQLLRAAVDAEDKAIVDAAAILAAGHGVRFVTTIRNGLHVDVRAERLDYDHLGRVR